MTSKLVSKGRSWTALLLFGMAMFSCAEEPESLGEMGEFVTDNPSTLPDADYYFSNGQPKFLEETDTSTDVIAITAYYESGIIKEIAHSGEFDGCSIPVGDYFSYDSTGVLLTKKNYHHFKGPDHVGCHDTRTVIIVEEYFPNGELEKLSSIETCYECDECPCGKTIFFDETGKEIHRKDFGDCYDGKLNCLD